MTRNIPVLATIVVALAVATMIALGFWQLDRMGQKEAQLARYERAQAVSSQVEWPSEAAEVEGALYRYSQVDCTRVLAIDTVAGRNSLGESGWAHVAQCQLAGGGTAAVALGWARAPVTPQWQGGQVSGFVGPYRGGAKLVASPPQAGLQQLAPPNPGDVPNNHLSYAVQWFLFALTAVVVYVLALRGRWRTSGR